MSSPRHRFRFPYGAMFAASLVFVLAPGCTAPKVDCFRNEGCTAPDPAGVIEGTVSYIGPRPLCKRDGDGDLVTPIVPLGRAILTLFRYDNPPPPEGSATSAENLMAIPATRFFDGIGAEDCMPNDPTPEEISEVIARSAAFTWPDIALGSDMTYQMRALYDRDEDFNPFFSVRNQPTAGDVIGGALENPLSTTLARIHFGSREQHPNGQRIIGVGVTLAAYVDTERPVFEASYDPLAASATMPLTSDPLELEDALFALTNLTLQHPSSDDARYVGDGSGQKGAFAAAGVSLEASPLARSWFVNEVDADRDGEPDLHPVLGAFNIPWLTPVVILQRARSSVEVASGIPDVLFVASVRPSAVATVRAFASSVEIIVPPVAVMRPGTAGDQCRTDLDALGLSGIPILAPGNVTTLLEHGPTDCQNLPSGEYNISAFGGVAAGELTPASSDVSEACLSNTSCFTWEGGAFSGQSWTIPNELGDAAQLCSSEVSECEFTSTEASLAKVQGTAARFVVTTDDPSSGQDADACATALDPLEMGPRAVTYTPPPPSCCEAIRHLCDVPLCGLTTVERDGESISVRSTPTSVVDGQPDCVPFAMPRTCCESDS